MKFTKQAKQNTTPVLSDEIKNRLDDLVDDIERGNISESIVHAYKKRLSMASASNRNSSQTEYKPRLKEEMARVAYIKILEKGISPDDALSYIKEIWDVSDDFITQAKNNTFPRASTAKNIVKSCDDHPKQKSMRREGAMDRRSLSNSNTPNQQLRSLHYQVTQYNKIKQLEKEVKELQTTTSENTIRLNTIEETLRRDNISMDKKDLCKYLYNIGHTQKELAIHFMVSVSTIRRWMGLKE